MLDIHCIVKAVFCFHLKHSFLYEKKKKLENLTTI